MKTLSDSEIIDALGGTAAVARLCRIKQPSVSGWRVMGIPDARRQFLELLRPDIFGVSPSEKKSFNSFPSSHSHAADAGVGG